MSDHHDDSRIHRDLASLLMRVPLFADFDLATRSAVAERIELFCLPGGTTLFRAGDPPDALYLVVSGSLTVHVTTSEGDRATVGRVSAGETVGEMALLSGHGRSATVTAVRDTELGRFSRQAFESLMLTHSGAMVHVARLMAQRLEAAQRSGRHGGSGQKTFALVPHDDEVAARDMANLLVAALRRFGATELVTADTGRARSSEWRQSVESTNTYVIYLADSTSTPWTRLCLRQADAVLLLAHAEKPASPWLAIESTLEVTPGRSAPELILICPQGFSAGAARRWLDTTPGSFHHHVRGGADFGRLARLITGHGCCLVLSGGGARGFAHIGVMRAIREAGVPIDLIGGTSIGAIMGAGGAMEWAHDEMARRFRRTFVATNPLSDYTFPIVSLVRGRKVTRLLRQEFGEVDISDLPIPFYCVTSNLTTGRADVHRWGPLWHWLRASVAIPGVLPPVFDADEVHVDGGATNNLPVDIMRAFRRGPVIGVDVGADGVVRGRVNILQILWRAGMVNSAAVSTAHRDLTDLLLTPTLDGVDMLDWQAFDAAIEAGYRHAQEHMTEIARVATG